MLADAVRSSGEERHYEYEGRFMTAVKDERGNELVHNWYLNGWLMRQVFANGDSYEYTYAREQGRFPAASVQITLPDHTTRGIVVAGSVPEYIRNAQ